MVRRFETIQKDLAVNLRRERIEAGISQEQLALMADVDRTYVSQIERAIGNPSISVIVKLASCLKKDINNLLNPNQE